MIIHGRTMKRERDATVPLGHVTVRVAGIWKNLAKLAEKPADPPNAVFIRPPLYIQRAEGTACTSGGLTAVPDAAFTLTQLVVAGADSIPIADTAKLRQDDLLRIDGLDADREEVSRIQAIHGNRVTLARPLMFAHRAGVIVEKLSIEWNKSSTALLRSGSRGESTVFLRDLPAAASHPYIRIGAASGNIAEEVHRFYIYRTESNADGFYQLPPLQRIGQIQLEASGDGRKVAVKFQPDFAQPRNQVDFVFKKSPTPDSAEDNHA
jgi:hypothetical protein